MEVFCTNEFKTIVNKLKKNKSYRTIEKDISDYFFSEKNKSIDDFKKGTKLNGSSPHFYIKKRLEGSGGYRCYYYIFIQQEDIYLLHIHPKTGSLGKENISDEQKSELLNKLSVVKKSKDLFLVEKNGKEIKYTHISERKKLQTTNK